ncbi:hypothetical protein ACEQ8H_007785 [Pleosporales sp. CAS-2024a]
MSTTHRSPAPGLTSFAIYEDPEDQALLPPTDMFDGDMSFGSEHAAAPDEALASIELDAESGQVLQPYRSSYTSRKSALQPRRSSGATRYSMVSAMPSDSSISSHPAPPASDGIDARYTPRKERPRFRNPESVRAMQMTSPPPTPTTETSRERLKGSYKLMTPNRSGTSETPVSKKSGSRRNSLREQHSPMPAPTPQQAPLVLLHVTILPPQVPYSHDLMVKIMPEWLVENYKLLEEKLQDIILMRRGLLIPHPRDEYDLLEERILESLELKTPRLLKCGHFVPPEYDSDQETDDDERSMSDDNTGRGSRMSGGTFTDENENGGRAPQHSMCADCHHELKRPGKGVGAGTRRWDIKIYAANGLMRANAWAACWGEMERCDVELQPWIPADLRKTLEKRVIEEQEAEKRKHMYAVELQRQIQDSTSKQKIAEEEAAERKRLEELEQQKSFEAAAAALERSIEEKAAEKKRFEDAIEEKIQEAKEAMRIEVERQAQMEASALAERLRMLETALQEQSKPAVAVSATQAPLRAADIPLGTLLKNYALILLKDQRNFVILVLGALVVVLVMHMGTEPKLHMPSITADDSPLEAVHTVVVTTTATTTATSFSTMTVTEVQTATSIHKVVLPMTECAVTQATAAAILDGTSSVSPAAFEEAHAVSSPSIHVEVEELPTTETIQEEKDLVALPVPEKLQETLEQDSAPIEDHAQASHATIIEHVDMTAQMVSEDATSTPEFCAAEPGYIFPSLLCTA